jgi:hypothetical protein
LSARAVVFCDGENEKLVCDHCSYEEWDQPVGTYPELRRRSVNVEAGWHSRRIIAAVFCGYCGKGVSGNTEESLREAQEEHRATCPSEDEDGG